MITFKKGNILEEKDAVITIPVNTKGTLGAGLAKQARDQFPILEGIYKAALKDDALDIDKPFLCMCHNRMFMFFCTKKDWRNKSQLDWIRQGLEAITKNYGSNDFDKIAFPMLGCGLGGLEWKDVFQLIHTHFSALEFPEVYVYGEEPNDDEYIFKILKEEDLPPIPDEDEE